MSRTVRLVAMVAAILTMTTTNAEMVYGDVGGIVHLYTYATNGNGDVVISTENVLSGCSSGFWLRSSDPGFKNVFAQLMAARVTQTKISVWAYNDQLWPESTGQFCRIDALDFAD